jgi:peptidoglycan-associated lipoprotein
MLRPMKTTLALALLLSLGACHHDKPAVTPTTPEPAAGPTDQAAAQKPMAQNTATQPVSPNLGMSADLAAKCNIHQQPGTAPKFEFDQANLTPEDRNVLDQLATCLTTGPMKGSAIQLTGRADPRGTEEYNLGLGSTRAHSVSSYLGKLGVEAAQMAVTTRGALDATGTDESGWREDRRVDIGLKS